MLWRAPLEKRQARCHTLLCSYRNTSSSSSSAGPRTGQGKHLKAISIACRAPLPDTEQAVCRVCSWGANSGTREAGGINGSATWGHVFQEAKGQLCGDAAGWARANQSSATLSRQAMIQNSVYKASSLAEPWHRHTKRDGIKRSTQPITVLKEVLNPSGYQKRGRNHSDNSDN